MREEGYYWVVLKYRKYVAPQTKRRIAEWSDNAWWVTGSADSIDLKCWEVEVLGKVIEGEWK